MKIYSFKAREGNFGDDLNDWLWPRLLGSFLDRGPDVTLIGIGSILDSRLLKIRGTKVVLGSGVRSTSNAAMLAKDLSIRFVRGPISARVIGGDTTFITDPAILISSLESDPHIRGNRVGIMPHYHSLPLLDWAGMAAELGCVYIDPRGTVEDTLALLRQCDRVITEAMHGAIAADALRIPWLRISFSSWRQEGFDVSSLKWLDWGLSANVDVTPRHLRPIPIIPSRALLRFPFLVSNYVAERKLRESIHQLSSTGEFQLSTRETHTTLLERTLNEVHHLVRWLGGQPSDSRSTANGRFVTL